VVDRCAFTRSHHGRNQVSAFTFGKKQAHLLLLLIWTQQSCADPSRSIHAQGVEPRRRSAKVMSVAQRKGAIGKREFSAPSELNPLGQLA
jgi:hypothetical protein